MAKVIMIQGTMSGAGKSLIAAGLCRIFHQDGLRVAPFKSQNMALNSFITSEGLEMGRAQVMQAEAAGTVPSVRMNPILLKPTSDNGSQVIVNGEVVGNMPAREYFEYKKSLVPAIMEAYQSLSAEFDVIVVEGAGSPAEINLKQFDIVNMGLAKMLDAPVLLVGDIDRGGVFAQLAGTMLLLEEEEKARVKGLIINKFRGDKSILDPGVEMLKKYTDVPVIGTVPYMYVDLEDEDSLAPRLSANYKNGLSTTERVALVDIAVIRLPHISNFTDFQPLERISGVHLHYVSKLSELGEPDLILLPGTKNTMGDLLWLRECGLESRLLQLAAAGVPMMGICGGFQMLGRELSDPEHVEAGGSMRGMGLLPMRTVFEGNKVRTQVCGVTGQMTGSWKELSNVPFSGYEIHMGRTIPEEGAAEFAKISERSENPSQHSEKPDVMYFDNVCQQSEKPDGMYFDNICGSYVHGIFDSAEMQQALVDMLLRRKGLEPGEGLFMSQKDYKEQQFDILADGLRRSLDMDMVYRILNGHGETAFG